MEQKAGPPLEGCCSLIEQARKHQQEIKGWKHHELQSACSGGAVRRMQLWHTEQFPVVTVLHWTSVMMLMFAGDMLHEHPSASPHPPPSVPAHSLSFSKCMHSRLLPLFSSYSCSHRTLCLPPPDPSPSPLLEQHTQPAAERRGEDAGGSTALLSRSTRELSAHYIWCSSHSSSSFSSSSSLVDLCILLPELHVPGTAHADDCSTDTTPNEGSKLVPPRGGRNNGEWQGAWAGSGAHVLRHALLVLIADLAHLADAAGAAALVAAALQGASAGALAGRLAAPALGSADVVAGAASLPGYCTAVSPAAVTAAVPVVAEGLAAAAIHALHDNEILAAAGRGRRGAVAEGRGDKGMER